MPASCIRSISSAAAAAETGAGCAAMEPPLASAFAPFGFCFPAAFAAAAVLPLQAASAPAASADSAEVLRKARRLAASGAINDGSCVVYSVFDIRDGPRELVGGTFVRVPYPLPGPGSVGDRRIVDQ